MPKTRVQKEEAVQVLTDKLNKAKAVVFTDYKGLNMKQLSKLRNELRNENAEFSITKNSLLDLALKTSHFSLPAFGEARLWRPTSHFQNPTAALFAYDDEISPIKILVKAFKDAATGKIKLGFLGKESLDEDRIQYLASLPTKDELRGKTVRVLVAPLQGMVSVLQGNLRNLVDALNQIKLQKGGEQDRD